MRVGPPPYRSSSPDYHLPGPVRPIPPPNLDDIVDHAFNTCTRTLSYTPTDGEWHDTKLFILDGERYSNLKRYVVQGLSVPTSYWAVREKCGTISDRISSRDFDKLKNTLNDIYNHCSSFNRTSMSKFSTFTEDLIGFCDDMSKYIAGENLLQDQINILSDEHASKLRVKRACATAKNILQRLASAAERHQGSCQTLVSDVVLFQGLTSADLISIKQVEQMLDTYKPDSRIMCLIYIPPGEIFDFMGSLVRDFVHSLDANMESAVAGLRSMHSMLARLQSDFSALAGYFDGISSWVDEDDPVVRSLAQVDLDMTVSKWAEVRTLAQNFQRTISNPNP